MSSAMARGLVVSRGSPGVASLRLGSLRSSRVTLSPSERANCVKPAGPPIVCSTRFAAVLSLQSIAAAQRSASVMRAFGDVRLRDRRVVEQVVASVGDRPVEALGALVDALERRRRGHELERAAHRKALIGAMRERRARPRIAHEDAEPAAFARLDLGELLVGEVQAFLDRGRARPRGKRRHGGREAGKERTTAVTMHGSFPNVLRGDRPHDCGERKAPRLSWERPRGRLCAPSAAGGVGPRLDRARASAIGLSAMHRVWFITGASSGFGRALAEAVLKRGDERNRLRPAKDGARFARLAIWEVRARDRA